LITPVTGLSLLLSYLDLADVHFTQVDRLVSLSVYT
jgi:hypothetical protein